MSGRIFLDEIYSKDGQNKVLDTKSFDANNNFEASNTGFNLNYQSANTALIINQIGTGDALNVSSNALVVDSNGKVGIGTNSPSQTLSVRNGSDNQIRVENGASTTQSYEFGRNGTTGLLTFYGNQTGYTGYVFSGVDGEKMRITNSGDTTSGNLLIQNPKDVGNVGSIYSSILSNGANTSSWHLKMTTQGVASYYIYGNGATAFGSDEKLKKNIETTRDGYIEDIKNLRVVKYHWKDQDETTSKELGLIAQEVEQVFPGLIQEHELEGVGEDVKHIKMSVIPFILVKGMQEQQALIESQQSQIDALTTKTQEQDSIIASLISRIEALESNTTP